MKKYTAKEIAEHLIDTPSLEGESTAHTTTICTTQTASC